jgi:hypothetical protein
LFCTLDIKHLVRQQHAADAYEFNNVYVVVQHPQQVAAASRQLQLDGDVDVLQRRALQHRGWVSLHTFLLPALSAATSRLFHYAGSKLHSIAYFGSPCIQRKLSVHELLMAAPGALQPERSGVCAMEVNGLG